MAEGHTEYGSFLLDNGRADEARKQFELAIKAKPNYAMAHFFMGQYHRDHGDPDQANSFFQDAATFAMEILPKFDRLAEQPGRIELRFLLSASYSHLDQPEESQSWYQKAMEALETSKTSFTVNPRWQRKAEMLLKTD